MWHIFGMWLFLVFVIIHIYMAIRADVLGKHTSVSTIFSGWRHFRD
jgi:Ni/Fe-hydrogenase 1 B-type cytochrome subunit